MQIAVGKVVTVVASHVLLVRVTREHLIAEVFLRDLQTVAVVEMVRPAYDGLLDASHVLGDHLRVLAADAAHFLCMVFVQIWISLLVARHSLMPGMSVRFPAHGGDSDLGGLDPVRHLLVDAPRRVDCVAFARYVATV